MKQRLLSFKSRILKMFIEVVSIVFAVLVALAADKWVENSDKLERKQRLLHNIQEEVSSNLASIKEANTELEQQIEKLSRVIVRLKSSETIEIDSDIKAIWRVSLPELRSTSWHSLTLQSEIFTLIELDKIEQLSAIYSLHVRIDNVGLRMIEQFGDNTANLVNPEQTLRTLRVLLYNLSALQQLHTSLQTLYEEYLQ